MTITDQDIERAREYHQGMTVSRPTTVYEFMAEYSAHVTAEKDAEIARLKARIKALERFREAARVMPSAAGITELRRTCSALETWAYTQGSQVRTLPRPPRKTGSFPKRTPSKNYRVARKWLEPHSQRYAAAMAMGLPSRCKRDALDKKCKKIASFPRIPCQNDARTSEKF